MCFDFLKQTNVSDYPWPSSDEVWTISLCQLMAAKNQSSAAVLFFDKFSPFDD